MAIAIDGETFAASASLIQIKAPNGRSDHRGLGTLARLPSPRLQRLEEMGQFHFLIPGHSRRWPDGELETKIFVSPGRPSQARDTKAFVKRRSGHEGALVCKKSIQLSPFSGTQC